jgi:hypothetical protein
MIPGESQCDWYVPKLIQTDITKEVKGTVSLSGLGFLINMKYFCCYG